MERESGGIILDQLKKLGVHVTGQEQDLQWIKIFKSSNQSFCFSL